MKNLTKQILGLFCLIQFIGFSAHAISCKSVVGSQKLTVNVISNRIRQGVKEAEGSFQTFMVQGALEGYYSAVALGVDPKIAKDNVYKASREMLHSRGLTAAAQGFYAAVGAGLPASEVSNRISAGKLHEPRSQGLHGRVEGYYIAVAFGTPPKEAARSVQHFGMQSFPNIESFKNLTTGFFAGLAFGLSPEQAEKNISEGRRVEEQVPGSLKKGPLSGFYIGTVLKDEMEE